MSKKLFLQALEQARAGNLDRALEILRSIHDRGFILRRIAHYIAQPDHREAAHKLDDAWRASIAEATPAAHAPALFTAPLPPSTVDAAPIERIDFSEPEPFLLWSSADWDTSPELALDDLKYTDVWALAALGALRLAERGRRPNVRHGGHSTAARFAHALGLDALAGGEMPSLVEPARTVQLTRVRTREEIEPVAERMTSLVLPGGEARDESLAVRYVLIELLRNAVQHSEDPLGAVAVAQRMDAGPHRERAMIQVAVADAGTGIPRTLARHHPHLTDYRQALERALLPHISGTFDEGLTGSFENAGLGLYVVSEMARRTGGRMLIATTGAALVLQGNGADVPASPRFLQPLGIGFPGTLVAFEIPTDAVEDYFALIKGILRTAEERTPKRASNRWLTFDEAGAEVPRVVLLGARENTSEAAKIGSEAIRPALIARQAIALDFSGIELCTQSWLHALLYEPIRIAWALRVPIHVVNADPAVREGLRFLEAYALGGLVGARMS